MNVLRLSETGRNGALQEACRTGDEYQVILLVGMRTDVNASDRTGKTAIGLASRGGHTRIVARLLEGGADVNAKDVMGWTALMHAAAYRHTTVVKQLMDSGADVRATNNCGQDALMMSTLQTGSPDGCLVLLLVDAYAAELSNSLFVDSCASSSAMPPYF